MEYHRVSNHLLTTAAAAQMLGLSRSTLAKWRITGDGPPFLKLGGHAVRYRCADIEEWAAGNLRRSTSETPEAA